MALAIDTSDRRRRRALRAATPLAALLIAALLVWQGSNAAFSATTTNTGDSWATGSLTLSNNGGGSTFSGTTAALFTESNRKPGDTGTKCITVASGGSLAGSLRLYRSAVSGTNATALAAAIDMSVQAANVGTAVNVDSTCTGFPGASTTVYSGTLAGMPTTYAGANQMPLTGGNERVAYRITWTINAAADNTVQSSSAVANLTWEVN